MLTIITIKNSKDFVLFTRLIINSKRYFAQCLKHGTVSMLTNNHSWKEVTVAPIDVAIAFAYYTTRKSLLEEQSLLSKQGGILMKSN